MLAGQVIGPISVICRSCGLVFEGSSFVEPAGLPLSPVRPSPLDRAAVAQTCPRSLGPHRAGEMVA